MSDDVQLDIGELFRALAHSGSGDSSILRAIAGDKRSLIENLTAYHPVKTASVVAGLMCFPELQSSSYRLETLLHLVVAVCNGKKKPRRQDIARWFCEIGHGVCGRQEDPAEDVFVSNILSSRGNFRVFEGLWEGGTFYLQRFVNIVEHLPSGPGYDDIREGVFALLALSEEVCRRTRLGRYAIGNENPLQELPKSVQLLAIDWRKHVRFSDSDLDRISIEADHLAAFIYDPRDRAKLLDQSISDSDLARHPVCVDEQYFYLAYPAAVSAAIRYFVIERIDAAKLRSTFLKALASEFAAAFADAPLLGERRGAAFHFHETKAGLIGEMMAEVDAGRFLHILCFLDDLEGFEQGGLGGVAPDKPALEDYIEDRVRKGREHAAGQTGFVNGISVLVGCGVGRGIRFGLPRDLPPQWKVTPFNAHDFATLGWYSDFKPLSLWRLHESEAIVAAGEVELLNINGPLNLIAWQRRLEGHLVPHGQIPEDFAGGKLMLMVEQNALRELRATVLAEHDPHCEVMPNGDVVVVRRLIDSIFEEDRSRPLYVGSEFVGAGLPLLYKGNHARWWLTFEVKSKTSSRVRYERWKLGSTWLPRIAQALDTALGRKLPDQIWIRFEFETAREVSGEKPEVMDIDEVRRHVSYQVNDSIVHVAATKKYEDAFFNPKNYAERALVEACVDGLLGMAVSADGKIRMGLLTSIVPNDYARQTHAFEAREFRDFVRDKLPHYPIKVDDVDIANLKFGMGWKVRKRELGGEIEGKQACTSYLSTLVSALETDLLDFLREFDRRQLLEAILANYEAAFVDRKTWRRTSAAVLALHEDGEATLTKMVEHEGRLGVVFQTCRVLLEMINCESRTAGGRAPGDLDISKLMGMTAQVISLGGWSDAIRWDAMEPRLRITPLGDVHANHDFFEKIVEPFGASANRTIVSSSAKKYEKLFDESEVVERVTGRIEDEFLKAWRAEFGAELDEFRHFVDICENSFIEKHQPFEVLSLSSFLSILIDEGSINENIIRVIVGALLYPSRSTWKSLPEGYIDADRQPWRYRRRLSVLRKPIIQVTNETDPLVLVSPSLVRDGFAYSVANYHAADFADSQIVSTEMKRWVGQARAAREIFNKEVSNELRKLGWQVDHDLQMTKLLGIGQDEKLGDVKRLGDIDVLAWDTSSNRVVVFECKDVQFKKTPGEIAEQLSKFRGVVGDDGKPDLLKRHVDRFDACHQRIELVGKYTGISKPRLEGCLMFRNPVPMAYAEEAISKIMNLRLFSNIERDFRICL